jgi:hypothetical protein
LVLKPVELNRGLSRMVTSAFIINVTVHRVHI